MRKLFVTLERSTAPFEMAEYGCSIFMNTDRERQRERPAGSFNIMTKRFPNVRVIERVRETVSVYFACLRAMYRLNSEIYDRQLHNGDAVSSSTL